jgi:hypothetical protein
VLGTEAQAEGGGLGTLPGGLAVKHGRGWLATAFVVGCVLLGTFLSLAIVVGFARRNPFGLADLVRPPYVPVLDMVGVAATAVAGALLGALAAILVLRRIQGGFDCPLCGTTNPSDAIVCTACGERFRDEAPLPPPSLREPGRSR